MFMCTSSSATDHSHSPASISARISSSPWMMASRSSPVSTPASASMVAWAWEPRMSWRYMRRSKPTLAVNACTKASVDSLKRPPQSWFCWLSLILLLTSGLREYGN